MRIITLILLLTILYWVVPAEYSQAAKKIFTQCLAALSSSARAQPVNDKERSLMSGAVLLEDKKIDGMLTVNGALTARKTDMQELIVNGAVQLSHCNIHQKAHINGSLDAHEAVFYADVQVNGAVNANHKARFYKDLTVDGQVSLKDSQAENIIITNKKGRHHKVNLQGTSRVGSITFTSGNGIVYLADKSVIKGTVIGGKISK